jgi:hypothetical protein
MNNPVKYTDPSGYETIGPGNGGIPPDPNWNHNEHLKAPVLFVDGVRIEPGGGGYGFFLGGGGGGGVGGGTGNATTQYFGVWTGNGPGLKGYSISRGALIDYANEHPGTVKLRGNGAYVQLELIGISSDGKAVYRNPLDDRISVNKQDFAAYIQWTETLNGLPLDYDKLMAFINVHFGDRISSMKHKPKFAINDAMVRIEADAETRGTVGAGPSNVYLRKGNFLNDQKLYAILDHEIAHAELYSNGIFNAWVKQYNSVDKALAWSEAVGYMHSFNAANKFNNPTMNYYAKTQLKHAVSALKSARK